ncbi:MAG: hypothetical protein ABIH67_01370 [Candidatus Uhrbacteria bacterium]
MDSGRSSVELERQASILERQEIIAPANFVSVFHETKAQFLPAIDQGGLKVDSEVKNIGEAKAMARRNALIDQAMPEKLRTKGLSRNNIYAYPFLEHGHGLLGADQRFVKRDPDDMRRIFEDALEKKEFFGSFLEYCRGIGVNTADEYVKTMTDPEYLKAQYPGEVVEMKVDPEKTYVGDLEYITRVMDDMNRGWSESEAIQQQAKKYWEQLITLEDFLKWYKKPEWAEDGDSIKDGDDYKDGEPWSNAGFYLIKDAPDNLPSMIHQPEILIPENIPQDHIKLVK